MARYVVVHYDALGNEKNRYYAGSSNDPASIIRLEYARQETEIGSLYMDLVPIYPASSFRIDDRLEVWVQVGDLAPILDMDGIWFIRLIRFKTDDNGNRYIHILAHDQIDILDRRIVAYNCNTIYSDMAGYSTAIMGALFDYNFGASCVDTLRNSSAYLVNTIAINYGVNTTRKDMCRRKVLPLFQELCEESNNAGYYLSFDLIKLNPTQLAMVAFTGQRGADHGLTSSSRIIATVDNGMLSYASLAYDYVEEYNYIYAGGRGEDNNRIAAVAFNNDAIAISPFNRREDFVDSDVADVAAAQAEANTRLFETRGKTVLNGHIQQIPSKIFRVHYNYGDIIGVEHEGSQFNIHLDTAKVVVNNTGEEQITIFSRNLSDSEY